MTWTQAIRQGGLWLLPSALVTFGLLALFHIVPLRDPTALGIAIKALMDVLVPVSWLCSIAVPVAAGQTKLTDCS